MCQVHTGAYVSLLAPGKPTIPLATQERLLRIITRSTYHYAYARQTQINWKKKQRKERKIKEWKGKKRERKMKGKVRKEKTGQEEKQGKEKRKNVTLADPRN